jgi:hypothetical protein
MMIVSIEEGRLENNELECFFLNANGICTLFHIADTHKLHFTLSSIFIILFYCWATYYPTDEPFIFLLGRTARRR